MSISILRSARLLRNVVLFLALFYIMFGITGVQFFRGAMSKRCQVRQAAPDGSISWVTAQPIRSCGSYYDGDNIKRPVESQEFPIIKGYTCPIGQSCRIVDVTQERPNGFISYDHIAAAVFSIFQSASEQGWTQTMYITMDADYAFAAAYHVLLIVLLNFVVMNMSVAIIADTFTQIRTEYQNTWEERKRCIMNY
jgi:hypothetical protein